MGLSIKVPSDLIDHKDALFMAADNYTVCQFRALPPPPLAYPLELKIESAADATADAKCHFGKCGHSAISLPRSASLFLFPSISMLALAMPQFKCRLTHCDAIASFLPFCFLSQIVCALELAKVEHVSALPLAACRFPLATCHLAHYFRAKHFAER